MVGEWGFFKQGLNKKEGLNYYFLLHESIGQPKLFNHKKRKEKWESLCMVYERLRDPRLET